MGDVSHDPDKTLDAAAQDLNHTVAENDPGTVGSSDCRGSDEDIVEVLDTLIETLIPQHRDLYQTLPQETLRPKLVRTVSDASSVTVRSRVIQPASESAASARQDDHSGTADSPDYLTLKLLGQGGMGTVHLARQVALGRDVAVKQLHGEVRRQQSAQDEFVAEAILTGILEHPNIVPIYELGRSPDGYIFYSMKNVRGRAWSDTMGSFSLDKNLDILIDVCDAIAFAHAEGVIHRDLKPQNIMTGSFGEVLVLDWGLALSSRPGTEVNSFAGTPAFMAPEMINPPFAVGTHSDVYLLGAILYMILTGKPPHGGRSGGDCLLEAARNKIGVPDKDHVHKLDPSGELMEVALRSMATKPEDRYRGVTEFQQAVRDFRSHHESLVLSSHAQESLELAQSTGDYTHYSRAVFGFEESSKLWDRNNQAKEGMTDARLLWALCAKDRDDFDLALSLLDDSMPEQQPIIRKLQEGKRERDSRATRLSVMRKVAVALLGFIIVGGTVLGGWIHVERGKALAAEEEKAKQAEALAEAETEKAKQAEALAEAETEKAKQAEALAEAEIKSRKRQEILRAKSEMDRFETEKLAQVLNAEIKILRAQVSALRAELQSIRETNPD